MKLPAVQDLYKSKATGDGAKVESRSRRKGGNDMTVGAFVSRHDVFDRQIYAERPEGFDFEVYGYMYKVRLNTFVPLDVLGGVDNFNRLETLAFWECSYNETLRHLVKMASLDRDTLFQELIELAQQLEGEVKKAFRTYVDRIVEAGDFSIKQFEFYAKEHGPSASPFGEGTWTDILSNEERLRRAWHETNTKILEFQQSLPKLLALILFIDAALTYPALRARPAEYEIMDKGHSTLTLQCKKWRDRTAGGVPIISQLEYPVYKREKKLYCYEPFYGFIKQLLPGVTIHSVVLEKAKFYKNLKDAVNLYCYDLSIAEKLIARCFNYLPVNVDLSDMRIPAWPGKMYSGIGPTRPLAEMLVAILISLLREKGYKINALYLGGDNFGVDIELPEALFYGLEERILGYSPKLKRFWPLSLTTDNPRHRNPLPSDFLSIQWFQRYQDEVRPAQAAVQNSLTFRDSCDKYIDWICTEPELEKYKDYDLYSGWQISEVIRTDPPLRETFQDKFARDLALIREWMPTHNNPEKPTDAYVLVKTPRGTRRVGAEFEVPNPRIEAAQLSIW